MTTYTVQPSKKPLLGYVRVPGDKSIAHRALIFASLAQEPVKVTGLGTGLDNQRSARAMASMGVGIIQERDGAGAPGAVIVKGQGLRGLRAPHRDIECGNSGTTMRILAGLLIAQEFSARLVGDQSLEARPMLRVIQPLARMGGTITGRLMTPPGELYPPLAVQAIRGRLSSLHYTMPVASAQVKSAILAASLYTEGITRLREPGPSRDHTERLLARMGVPVTTHEDHLIEVNTLRWKGDLGIDRIDIPGDPSHAAFIIAAGLLAGVERVTVGEVCINPRRTGFIDVLGAMGARVEREAMELDRPEPTADLSLSRGAGDELTGTVIEGDATLRSLDELPILAVVAARASGVTEIRDAAELRVKESDRIATTCELLRAFGVSVETRDDGLVIEGAPERPFRSARIHAQGDHRIAMSAAVGALVADGPVRVVGAESVDTSFPEFVNVMRSLGADIELLS